ncbi:hypothetical protein HWI79_3764 [Cryptosporidium felis]|nr:hypothetical protein HWI79_3764 [Cryptosporidium felis]
MSAQNKRKTDRPEIKPCPTPLIPDETGLSEKQFLVVTLEDDELHKVPFLGNYVVFSDGSKFKRLLLCNTHYRHFFEVKVTNPKGEFKIQNEYGEVKFIFGTHVHSVNADKIIEKKSGFQDGVNMVTSKMYFYSNIPNRPSYYNSSVSLLVPWNFNFLRDQEYITAGQDGAMFKGIFSLYYKEIRMPDRRTGDNVEFFTLERTYAVFESPTHSYGVPIPRNMRCIVDMNRDEIRCFDSTDDYKYKVNIGHLCVGEMEMLTINVLRFRVIIAGSPKEVFDIGFSRLNGLDPNGDDN